MLSFIGRYWFVLFGSFSKQTDLMRNVLVMKALSSLFPFSFFNLFSPNHLSEHSLMRVLGIPHDERWIILIYYVVFCNSLDDLRNSAQ